MRCVSPLKLRQKGSFNVVPCGKCNFCLSNKRADWSLRLMHELKISNTANFLTLTYSEEHKPTNDSLCKQDVQNFMKRLRKINSHRLRYYTVGEYGTQTNRPHYHSILFNLDINLVSQVPDVWKLGHVLVGTVTPASIHYVTKYVINRLDEVQNKEPPFALISKGIGKNYLTPEMIHWHKSDMRDYAQFHGRIQRLPRYYRDKIFTTVEKQLISLRLPELDTQLYWEEIEKLSKYHDDPYVYREEVIQNKHEKIKSKINQFNTL